MPKPVALPIRPVRTMLCPVPGSSVINGPRVAKGWARLLTLAALSLSGLLPARAALAQSADDSGWFDAPGGAESEAAPAPEPYYPQPDADEASSEAAAPQAAVADTDPSALTTFRPALDPYGAWVTDSRYGTVWVPNRDVVGADFAPYVSRGHWALTADNDWIWASDYPFGWAVFHYGRWVWLPGNGWAWVPGRTYANAWVVWRVPTAGYAYVGWAPMPPTWGWWNGYAVGVWYSPPLPYVFCPSAYVFDYRVHGHIVRDRYLVNDIARHSHVYPTPYRAPAQPTLHAAAAPGVRPAPPPIGASRAPRGPAISAARVPPSAVPAVRTLPPPNATRLSSVRSAPTRLTPQRLPSSEARLRSTPRVPSAARDSFAPSVVRRSVPSSSTTWAPRTSAPSRVRVEPRHVSPSPSRVRVAPAPSRSYSPAPARTYAPVRSFAPSFPRMHSGGGGGRRR